MDLLQVKNVRFANKTAAELYMSIIANASKKKQERFRLAINERAKEKIFSVEELETYTINSEDIKEVLKNL